MKTQAWAWLAAGVLAAGLNASYHDGGMPWAHEVVDRVTDRSEEILALATGRTDRLVEVAQRVQDRNEADSCRLSTALARVQTRISRSQTQFARWESMPDREVARLDRLEANRIRIQDRVNAQLVRIRVPEVPPVPMVHVNVNGVKVSAVCPRVRVPQVHVPQVHVPQVDVKVPAVHVEVPDVEVDDGDSGPI